MMLGLSVFALPLFADAPSEHDKECAKEALKHHFPEQFVSVTLKKFKVPEDQQAAIIKELNEKDKQIVKMVEDKAATMDPNPLKNPEQRQQAVKLFKDTLFEQFTAVLNAHGVTDDDQIQKMLEDIQLQKAKRFTQCMEKVNPDIMNKKPGAAPADDDKDN